MNESSNVNHVNLDEMLERREKRANLQAELLRKYHETVISFTMNIPGQIKTSKLIRAGFEIGKKSLLEKLHAKNFQINSMFEIHEKTGDELLLSIKADADELKQIAISIEEQNDLGRLFDIDVINSQGEKISRDKFRKCLICDRQAQECARSRTHSVSEMQDAVRKILENAAIIIA